MKHGVHFEVKNKELRNLSAISFTVVDTSTMFWLLRSLTHYALASTQACRGGGLRGAQSPFLKFWIFYLFSTYCMTRHDYKRSTLSHKANSIHIDPRTGSYEEGVVKNSCIH